MKSAYAKVLTLILALLLAIPALTACNSGGEGTEPVVDEQPPVGEQKKDDEDPDADDVEYVVNSRYVLKTALNVREEPSADSRQKKRSELSDSDKLKSAEGDAAVLKEGALVDCQEVSGDWMRIESGWICCREGDEIYITEPVALMDHPEKDDGTPDMDRFYDEDGKVFSITETEEKLTGTYGFSYNSDDSMEFYPDGTCMYHVKPGEAMPQFDENGNCDGRYNYRNGKVYFRIGGSTVVDVFVIKDGELIWQ